MLIIGAFQHSIELEEALAELEQDGIYRSHILAIPMNIYPGDSKESLEEFHDFYSKGVEVGIACATACSVVGTSAGFRLNWGPIIWGLIAAFMGFVIGFGLYFFFNKYSRLSDSKRFPEVTIIVQCSEQAADSVIRIMWKYEALKIGKVTEASYDETGSSL